jgi:hypothetical protein
MNNTTIIELDDINGITETKENTVLVSGMKLSEDLAREIACENNEFCEVVFTETDYDTLYKDYAHTEVVFKYMDKLWSFTYQSYESHYGSGSSQYYDCIIQEVEYYEEEVKTVVKGYRAV